MTRIAFILSFAFFFSLQLTACGDRPEGAAETSVRSETKTERPETPAAPASRREPAASAEEMPLAPIGQKAGRKGPRADSPSLSSPGAATKPAPVAEGSASKETGGDPPSHALWDAQLRQYVNAAGQVDYRSWKKEQEELEKYLDELAAHPAKADWSQAEQMAYWINAYNAFTVKLILDNYPVGSITDLHGGNPWDVKWIQLGDRTYSLNQIEHDILRPRYQEPRVHFAVNCAARSCPPLLNRAWTADNLEGYFQQQTKAFINDPQYNQLAPGAVEISRIFDWYAADFGNVLSFLNRYAKGVTIQPDARIGYLEYDWGLNEDLP